MRCDGTVNLEAVGAQARTRCSLGRSRAYLLLWACYWRRLAGAAVGGRHSRSAPRQNQPQCACGVVCFEAVAVAISVAIPIAVSLSSLHAPRAGVIVSHNPGKTIPLNQSMRLPSVSSQIWIRRGTSCTASSNAYRSSGGRWTVGNWSSPSTIAVSLCDRVFANNKAVKGAIFHPSRWSSIRCVQKTNSIGDEEQQTRT